MALKEKNVSPYSFHLESRISLHGVFFNAVGSHEGQGHLHRWVKNQLETPPLLLEFLLHILGGAGRHEKGGLQLLHIQEIFLKKCHVWNSFQKLFKNKQY